MKAFMVNDQTAGASGMQLAELPEPQASINDVVVQVYAAGFAKYGAFPLLGVKPSGKAAT